VKRTTKITLGEYELIALQDMLKKKLIELSAHIEILKERHLGWSFHARQVIESTKSLKRVNKALKRIRS